MAKNSEETRLKTPKTAARLVQNLKHGKKIQPWIINRLDWKLADAMTATEWKFVTS